MYGHNERKVETIIGYSFDNKDTINKALTHSGFNVDCHSVKNNYQRMEFLGDALLDFVIADELYRRFPEYDEGMLTKLRANLVSKTPLAEIIDKTGIADCIYCDKNTTKISDKMKSDIFEALVAGIYLDSKDIIAPKNFILKFLGEKIDKEVKTDMVDYKSMLYEYANFNRMKLDFREDRREGLPHNLTFYMSLLIDGEFISSGHGKTKREAEQMCCKSAFEKLGVKR